MGTTVRRLGALAAVVAAGLLVGAAAPAGAQDIPVTGAFTATGTFELFDCDFAHEHTAGGGDLTGLGASTFSLDFCVAAPDVLEDPWPVTSGTFTVIAPAGTLTGTMDGSFLAGTPQADGRFPFTYLLTITGGTGAYAGAGGRLTLDGLLEYVPIFDRNLEGTVSGTVTAPPPVHTPTSKADCKHDNWRNRTDEHGTVFRNKAACIRWVKRHS
jgi:hypothetical protein